MNVWPVIVVMAVSIMSRAVTGYIYLPDLRMNVRVNLTFIL